jgi:hypothetical protein
MASNYDPLDQNLLSINILFKMKLSHSYQNYCKIDSAFVSVKNFSFAYFLVEVKFYFAVYLWIFVLMLLEILQSCHIHKSDTCSKADGQEKIYFCRRVCVCASDLSQASQHTH